MIDNPQQFEHEPDPVLVRYLSEDNDRKRAAVHVGFNHVRVKKKNGSITIRHFRKPNDLCGCGSGKKVKRCHR